MIKFKIRRQDGDRVWHETFSVEETPGMSVLEALFFVQERLDGGLCFRYSCRGAVCGSCAMLINMVPRLACRTQVSDAQSEMTVDAVKWGALARPVAKVGKDEILIEPLPNMKVIRDLVVDMEHFYELLDYIKPWISAGEEVPEGGNLMSPKVEQKIEAYTNCILCATCYGACPVAGRDETYLGPAALAKAWRFYLDPREKEKDKRARLEAVNNQSGVWGCDVVFKCTAICPKKVTPTQGILAQRRQIPKNKIKNIFNRGKKSED
ncbi:MAG: succinate dehydrogenase/fumarate reductase iron-sulfur subunit [ANME-2 cluster archaeon]|nr:succinate dehydrogenase/fumarate reductase iron-sulfur subunit [ANME-2 cluster archaeon]MDF1557518.1 succinate dehydrogenase/fumarate reductase iron-sulfur subunit [ANME-2 cluster archaeon]